MWRINRREMKPRQSCDTLVPLNVTTGLKAWLLLHITVISRDDQIERPQLNIDLSRRVRTHVRRLRWWLAPRAEKKKELPTVETQPVHKSLDRIWGFKIYTNHCATPTRAKRSQPGSSQNQEKSLLWVFFFFLNLFFLSPRSVLFNMKSHS